ncbi:MAG: zinc-dependent metalloprotease [Gemmatimonadota bacterium]
MTRRTGINWWMRQATLALAVMLAAPAVAVAQKDGDGEEEKDPFEKLVDGAEHIEGYFDMYRKDGKLYLAVMPEQLDQDFLMDMRVAQGIGAGGLFGGTTLSFFEMDLMALERHGEKLYLMQRPHRFGAPDDARAQDAVDITLGSSVVQSAKVEATRPDSAAVIDVTEWFVSDLSGVSRRLRFVARTRTGQPGSVSFDKGRSFLEETKGFENNVGIRTRLTFKPGQPVGLPSVPDGRYISLSVHYTLARLPELPMERRLADERLGNFTTVHKDFSLEDSTFFRRYVNRWRLERGEQVGDRWRPVQPIVYYIDHNVPDEYRGWFKEGVERWNRAFEAAGWEGALEARDLPEGADPDDMQYSTLRWNTSDRPGYGAIGPSKVDPRTGETLDADILFEANMFRGFRNTWRNLVNPMTAAEAFDQALGVGAFEAPEGEAPGVELPGFGTALEAQGSLAGLLLAAKGEADPGAPLPDEILEAFTIWVVMHEVGHTLGLQHNFRSSASTPNELLHDTDFTSRNGVFSSVMEYPTINLSANGANGHWYTSAPGSYDRWVITYGYANDQEEADAAARDVSKLEHMFGTEAGGPGALDPTINVYDLGADPLAWGAERSELIRGMWERLPEYVLEDNTPYAEMRGALGQLMNEYARAVAPAVKYIGGQYMNRDRFGDGRQPFVNVPKTEQEKALALLVDRVFAVDALTLSEEMLQSIGPERRSGWGQANTINGRYDFPYHSLTLNLQSNVLNQLLGAARLARIRDSETKFGYTNVVTIPELFGALTDAIWSDLSARTISASRRDLQRAYLDAMTNLIVEPAQGTPADARSVARAQLTQLRGSIRNAAAGGAYTRAHLAESLARIEKALDAGLEAEG